MIVSWTGEMGSMPEPSELERHIPSLRRYAFSLLGDSGEADDLVQDCLVLALERMGSRRGGDVRSWLFTIMHNLSVSRWRRWRRRSPVLTAFAGADAAGPAPQDASAELSDVLRGLDLLNDEQRRVLLLVGVEGFDYAEVAAILKLPLGTVMSRLSRARDTLRGFMDGSGRAVLRRVK